MFTELPRLKGSYSPCLTDIDSKAALKSAVSACSMHPAADLLAYGACPMQARPCRLLS